MTANHPHSTPRPWTFCHADDTSYDLIGADKTRVAKMDGRIEVPPSPEDAVLIARAVNCHDELVAALDAFVSAWDRSDTLDGHEAVGLAKAALAKARGETS